MRTTKQVMISMPPAMVEKIDLIASAGRWTRSGLIGAIVENWLIEPPETPSRDTEAGDAK